MQFSATIFPGRLTYLSLSEGCAAQMCPGSQSIVSMPSCLCDRARGGIKGRTSKRDATIDNAEKKHPESGPLDFSRSWWEVEIGLNGWRESGADDLQSSQPENSFSSQWEHGGKT